MHNDGFFTAGELAAIFGVSKQTLLYYDRIDLLKPDFVADNGYPTTPSSSTWNWKSS